MSYLRKCPYPETSPVARALNQLGDKWTLLVIRALMDGPVRRIDLKRERCVGISEEQLRWALARLEDDGLMTTTRYNEVPPRVMCELTPRGLDVKPVLIALAQWAGTYALRCRGCRVPISDHQGLYCDPCWGRRAEVGAEAHDLELARVA